MRWWRKQEPREPVKGYLRIDRYTTEIETLELVGKAFRIVAKPFTVFDGPFEGPITVLDIHRYAAWEGTEILRFPDVQRGDQIVLTYDLSVNDLRTPDGSRVAT